MANNVGKNGRSGTGVRATNKGTTRKTPSTKTSVGGVSGDKEASGSVEEPIIKFEWKQDPRDVYIADPSDADYHAMVEFCEDNNLKLKCHNNQDVSDCSGQWDTIALFVFENTEDALIFKLKFK